MEIVIGDVSFRGKFVALLGIATLWLLPTAINAASGGAALGGDAMKLEDIPGSPLKRVILTPKAVERLGIETGKMSEQPIVLKQVVGGRIIPPDQVVEKLAGGGFGGFGRVAIPKATTPAAALNAPVDERWVVVTLSKGEWDRLRKDKPARIVPLATRDKSGKSVAALPSGKDPIEDPKRSMLKVFYKVASKDHGLKLFDRVRVELPQSGSDEKRRVVPYGAVYYDGKGDAWVYVNLEPLVYERRPIKVERVIGDLAVLTDGPAVGTPVVTTGAALLYGSEVIFKK